MSLAGNGVVAIWHNLLPEFRAEFYEWHNREHMPERLAVPGFRRGRRYRAIEGEPEFFNLYETAHPGILSSPEYLARLNSPTAWTKRVLPGFRDVSRSLCRVAGSMGVGQGGVILTRRFDVAAEERAAVATRLTGHVFPEITALPGITGAHLCLADEAASGIRTVEASVRTVPTLVPTWIVLIEGVTAPQVKSASETLSAALSAAEVSVPASVAVYQLEISRDNLDATQGAYGSK